MQFILIFFFWGGGECLEYHSHCPWGKHYSGAKLSVPEGIPGIKLYFSRSGRGYLHGEILLDNIGIHNIVAFFSTIVKKDILKLTLLRLIDSLR